MGRIRTDLVEKALPFLNGTDGTVSLGSSRMQCYRGALYSYGSHYPLLFPIYGKHGALEKPLLFVNDHGYSATTGMHISAARQYADAVVSLPRSVTGNPTREQVMEAIKEEYREKFKELGKTPARAFRKRERLADRCALLRSAWEALTDDRLKLGDN